nr:10021_t:CDS:2 [Entrophospora candida]
MTNKSTTAGIIEIPKRKTTMVKTEKRKLPLKTNSKRSDSSNSNSNNSILSTSPSGITTEAASTTTNNQSKSRTITINDSSSESSDNTLVTSPTQLTSSSPLQLNNIHLTEEEIKLKQLEQAKKILLRQQEAPSFRHELQLKETKEPTRGRSLQSLKRDQLRSPSPSPRYTSSPTPPLLLKRRQQQSDTNYYHAESDDSNASNNSSITNKKTATKKRNNTLNASKPVCTCLKPDSIWCQMCESKRFQQRFSNWTSGNKDIDNFIQETQKNSIGPLNYVEWIQHNRFRNIQKIDEGGYGIVYSATWLDGPRWIQDQKDPKKWTRENNKKERKEEEEEKQKRIKVDELLSKPIYHSQLYDFGDEQFLDFMTNLTESEVGSTYEPPQSPSNESTSSSKVTCGELESMSITNTTDDI